MNSTRATEYRSRLSLLIKEGDNLILSALGAYSSNQFDKVAQGLGLEPNVLRQTLPKMEVDYQAWYSESLAVVRQLIPSRLDDFESHYRKPKNRKVINYETYRIEDALQGLMLRNHRGDLVFGPDACIPHLQQQLSILKAAERRLDSSLYDIKQLVRADLLDSETEAARELLKKGFERAAGVIAGVVLEAHLSQVVENHKLNMRKANPSIADFNELLKSAEVIDTPTWRQLQRLADIRNMCSHKKQRDATREEVEELVSGVEKTIKALY